MNDHRPWIYGPNVGSCRMCSLPWPCPESERPDARAGITPADPDRACMHADFAAFVDVNRLTASDALPDVIGYSADVRIECGNCGERFRFIGVPAGLLPDRPSCSVDEFEAHLPIRPATSDDDFGLGIPGFAVRWRP